MIDQNFIINTDRLRKSKELKVKVHVKSSSDFLKGEDTKLNFGQTVELQGEIYVVDDQLVLHFELVLASAISPCNICNEEAPAEVKIKDFYHVEDLCQIKSPYFDFSSIIRDEILLAVPRFTECNEGNCPDRELIKPYMCRKD